ncbi:hypothetical protein CUJ84_pRLN3000404 (plasmid) [Rhizobium leguminosarum]|uniref:Uncharacterized protein n=1 Tax=Rhizobium leguminosarum TaxID=384 RepID=A0A2K9ZH12_RHILE|nr:hypothetical protein CUJ84_pRLN3000404 [Rhizobium leguminosarum]
MCVDAKRKRAYTPNIGHRVHDPLKAVIGRRPPINQEESDMMQLNETTLKDRERPANAFLASTRRGLGLAP